MALSVIKRSALQLAYHEQEDLLSYLVEEAWLFSVRYDQGRRAIGNGFGGSLKIALRNKVVDWQRQRNGRTKWQFKDRVYERVIPVFVPLEDRGDGVDHSQLGDLDSGGLSDLLGLQRARGGKGARSTEEADRPGHDRVA